jgi:hypothetical protein
LKEGGVNATDQARPRVCAQVGGIAPEDLTGERNSRRPQHQTDRHLAGPPVAVEDAFDISLEDGMRAVRTYE